MRRSTYKVLRDLTSQKIDRTSLISLSQEKVKEILKKKIKIGTNITLQGKYKTPAPPQDIVDAFVQLLSGDCIEILAALSNQNLKSLFHKFNMIST